MAKLNATPDPVHIEHLGHEVLLGKLEVKKDPLNLKFKNYVATPAKLPTPPARVRRSDAVPVWPMYLNDTLPDCTTATVGHLVEVWSAVAGHPIVPSDADVKQMFDRTGPEDQGRYILDILNDWRKNGFGPNKEPITAFVQIDPKNVAHMKLAIWLFGGVFCGLEMPLSAQAQSDPSKTWAVGRGANGAPGTWGGHAVPIINYWTSKSRYGAITWGYLQPLTTGFWTTYGDEAYAVISPEWVKAQGDSPVPGFNMTKLLADLAAIKGK